MTGWYYAAEGEPRGPVSEPELVRLFETGELGGETLVWTEGMAEWTAGRDVDGLVSSAEKRALPPILARGVPCEVEPEQRTSGRRVRPWVRYWAKMIDFFLATILIGVWRTLVAVLVLAGFIWLMVLGASET